VADAFARLLRHHRSQRRWSQERLGLAADVSSRHLSFLETAKAQPSRDMVLHLAEVLDLELRDRNDLLVSAGFAALYPTTSLDSLTMAPIHRTIELLLAQQEPYGVVLVDRCFDVLRLNGGAQRLFGTFFELVDFPPRIASNLVRATLHPQGLRPFIVNFPEVAGVTLQSPDDVARRELLREVKTYPGVAALAERARPRGLPAATVHLRRAGLDLQLFTLLTSIGTPLDVTAQDLTLESFFPADDGTDRWFRSVS
jgi:transcriptional regulator with XRE-family HTH domain